MMLQKQNFEMKYNFQKLDDFANRIIWEFEMIDDRLLNALDSEFFLSGQKQDGEFIRVKCSDSDMEIGEALKGFREVLREANAVRYVLVRIGWVSKENDSSKGDEEENVFKAVMFSAADKWENKVAVVKKIIRAESSNVLRMESVFEQKRSSILDGISFGLLENYDEKFGRPKLS